MAATVMVPDRSLEQRMDALARANMVRVRRAQLKRDVRAGRRNAAALLIEWPQEIDTMKVFDLLLAVPQVGRVKADKILKRQAISPSKTVGGLSERQRRVLVTALGGTIRSR